MTLLQACGPVLLPLVLLSLAVASAALDRCWFWWRWRRRPLARRRPLLVDAFTIQCMEPLLEAAVLVAPLLGLFGSVLALMRVLDEANAPSSALLRNYSLVLVSTAYGLAIALAALVVLLLNRALRRWQLQCLRRQEG